MLVARHVEPESGEPRIRRSREVEILSVLVEAGIEHVAHAVGDLRRFPLLEGIYKQSMQSAGELLGVSGPLAVGRPGLAERGGEAAEIVGVDQLGRGVVKIDVPQLQPLVAVCNLLAIGRPRRSVEKRWRV